MLKKMAALLLVCASAATWTNCGSTSSHYVYAAIPASSEIVVYREDPNTGILIALTTSPVSAGSGVHALKLHPSNKFIYAANSGSNDISLFTINTGALTETGARTSVLPGTGPNLLAMDSGGNYLYVGDAGSNTISVFSIDAGSGALSQVPGSPFPIGLTALNLQVAPSGNVLYVTGTAGALGFVEAFSVSAGVLTAPLPNSPYLTGTNPDGLVINAAGTFLYTANSAPDNSLSEFAINSDGSLGTPTIIGGGTLSSPVALFIDKSGKYLYVANDSTSGSLIAYSIGTDGGLTLLSTSVFGTGANPDTIAGDPSGNYLFVGNQSSPVVQSFSLNTSSGALTSVASYSVPGTVTSIAVLP